MTARDRIATADVLARFPLNSTLRHKATGLLFTMGARDGQGSRFHLMQLAPARKGLLEAQVIDKEYERSE